MREIKFRCYDKYTDCMLEWENLVEAGDLREMLLHGHEEDDEYSKLMQSTGLKDKNGKEIYEGDIVLYDRNTAPEIDRYKYIVKWERDRFILDHNFSEITDGITWEITEVIGNIYESEDNR